jgi:hypothetical protein
MGLSVGQNLATVRDMKLLHILLRRRALPGELLVDADL